MTQFAVKTVFPFEGRTKPVPIDATGDAYETPLFFRERLSDLARLSYVRAKLRYQVEVVGSAAGSGSLKLYAGGDVVAEVDLGLETGVYSGTIPFVAAGVSGDADLKLVLNVGSAASSEATAEILGQIVIEHPLVIGVA